MATLTIRNLPESTRRALKQRAADHDRSMEAEVREILERAVAPRSRFIVDWIEAGHGLDVDFPLPERSLPRRVDLE